jgi:hypothetical protein
MVGSVSSNSVVTMQQTTQNSSSSSTLTDAQLETISSTLGEYDSSNLSSEDAASIIEAFEEAGIQPSEELVSAMEAEGFDAKTVGDTAGVGGPQGGGGMPPPPPPSEEEVSEVSDLLDTLLSLEEDDDETTTDSSSEIMEYTNRILNLNEESKSDVMEMIEKFSRNEEGYSDTEVSNILKSSLNSVLGDSDNYNKVSFYA